VVFRYRSEAHGPDSTDAINATARRLLLERGRALIGRTLARPSPGAEPRVCLKLTLLNPTATPADIDDLIDTVLSAAREAARRHEEQLA
jgi:L-2,4-diaminobutyrate decarboxylase